MINICKNAESLLIHFVLSKRFDFDSDMIEDDTCKGVIVKNFVSTSEIKNCIHFIILKNQTGLEEVVWMKLCLMKL